MILSQREENLFSLLNDPNQMSKQLDKELPPKSFLDPYSTISKASSNSFMSSLQKTLNLGTARSNMSLKP